MMKLPEAYSGQRDTRVSHLSWNLAGHSSGTKDPYTPMGTLLSKTWRPTLVHLPIGSRLTPRLMRACARSRLRVLSVFVRIVTGLDTSFASKNSMAWGRGKT